jgi:hypothetical protein
MISHEFDVTYTSHLSATVRLIIPYEDCCTADFDSKVKVMGEPLNKYWGFSWGDHARERTQRITSDTPETLTQAIQEFKADIVRTLTVKRTFSYTLGVVYTSPVRARVELGIHRTDCDRLIMRDIILLGEYASTVWGTLRKDGNRYRHRYVTVAAAHQLEAAIDKLRGEIEMELRAAAAPPKPEDKTETYDAYGLAYIIREEYLDEPGADEPCRVRLTVLIEREHLQGLRKVSLLDHDLGPDWGYPEGTLRYEGDLLWGTNWEELRTLVTEFRDEVHDTLTEAMTPKSTPVNTYTIEV